MDMILEKKTQMTWVHFNLRPHFPEGLVVGASVGLAVWAVVVGACVDLAVGPAVDGACVGFVVVGAFVGLEVVLAIVEGAVFPSDSIDFILDNSGFLPYPHESLKSSRVMAQTIAPPNPCAFM